MNFRPEKKLGFGLMRLPQTDPNDSGSIDIEQLKKMVDLFIERGFTYFDTAWMYNAFKSENAVREVLTSRHPRETFTLATKLHAGFIETLEDRDRIFNAQLEKTGAAYFDYYLIHGIEGPMLEKYERLECFDWLLKKKEEGLVRHCGFSFHDKPELLDRILTDHPQMEFVQLQINYLDWDSLVAQSGKCYEVAKKHGKKVVVMEPVKGGTLAKLPEEAMKLFRDFYKDESVTPASLAIRYVASLDNVMMVLSGMSDLSQLDDNTSYMQDLVPLSDEERKLVDAITKILKSTIKVPCTSCRYCLEVCPMNINMPAYFGLLNLYAVTGKKSNMYYERYSLDHGKASECLKCGQCEGNCPQHIQIRDLLEEFAQLYEG